MAHATIRLVVFANNIVSGTFIDRLFVSRLSWLSKYLEELGYPLPPPFYIRAIVFYDILLYISAFPTLFIVHRYLLGHTPLFSLLLSLILSTSMTLVFLGVSVLVPVIRANNIKTHINAYLPYMLLIMTALAASGMGVQRIIEKSSELVRNKHAYNTLMRIINRIVRGEDVSEALYKESLITTSPTLVEVYEGLSSLSQTGVGVYDFLFTSLNSVLDSLEAKLREVVDKLSMIMEIYIVIALVFPLLSMISVLFLGGFGGLPLPADVMLLIISFFVVPLIFVVLILIVDAITSEVRL